MKIYRFLALVMIGILTIGGLGSALAQEDSMIAPLALAGQPVVLEFNTGAAGPPLIEPLADGRMTFRVVGQGEVTGSMTGTISARVSEVTTMPAPPFHPVSVMFSIENEQGTIEGYYVGSLHLPPGGDQAMIRAAGQVLSVSGAYADLYLAEVLVNSTVQFVDGRSVGESGTMTLAPR